MPSLLIREAAVWKYMPIAQQEQDFERLHPDAPGLPVEPCYEYRASNASRIVIAVNLPSAFLIGTPDGCPRSALLRASERAKLDVTAKNKTVLFGTLIVFGIVGQWWLVGRWIDQRRSLLKPMWRWIVPVVMITAAGVVMVPTAFLSGEVAEFISVISGMFALLAWIFLIIMFLAYGIGWGIRKIGKQDRTLTNSRA
jgi:hypothetical protein